MIVYTEKRCYMEVYIGKSWGLHMYTYTISVQLTVIISDQDEGGTGFSFPGIPGVWIKTKPCNEQLIKFQHIIIYDVEHSKCRRADWFKDKFTDCIHYISATII